jgi:hypothetical protein
MFGVKMDFLAYCSTATLLTAADMYEQEGNLQEKLEPT